MSDRSTRGHPQVIQGCFTGGLPSIVARGSAGALASSPVAAHERGSIQRSVRPGATHPVLPQAGSVRSDREGDALLLPERFRLTPSHGQPLPLAVQRKMEASFGADFSRVRVHVGSQAQQIGALAFTWGSEIFFAPGHYRPHDSHGRRLLGHELAHVVQQRAGRVRNPFGRGVAVVQNRAMEAEAERMGLLVAADRPPAGTGPQRARTGPAAGAGAAEGQARTHPGTAQPYIAKGTTVYYNSEKTSFTQNQSEENFKRSLIALGSRPGFPLNNATAITWNEFATTHAGYQARSSGAPTGGKYRKQVKAQFDDPTRVYCYLANANIQDREPAYTGLLLSFKDMAEKQPSEPLPDNASAKELKAAKCVIESLEDMGIRVPKTQSGTVSQWHTYFRGQGLDYRQDNNYIVVFVRSLGFRLVSTALTAWDQWQPEVGNYIVMTQDGSQHSGVGHAIGVKVTQGNDNLLVKTIYDRQRLTDNWNIHVSYVYKIP